MTLVAFLLVALILVLVAVGGIIRAIGDGRRPAVETAMSSAPECAIAPESAVDAEILAELRLILQELQKPNKPVHHIKL